MARAVQGLGSGPATEAVSTKCVLPYGRHELTSLKTALGGAGGPPCGHAIVLALRVSGLVARPVSSGVPHVSRGQCLIALFVSVARCFLLDTRMLTSWPASEGDVGCRGGASTGIPTPAATGRLGYSWAAGIQWYAPRDSDANRSGCLPPRGCKTGLATSWLRSACPSRHHSPRSNRGPAPGALHGVPVDRRSRPSPKTIDGPRLQSCTRGAL